MNNIKKLTCWWTLKRNRARDIILTENCEKRQIHSPINPRETHHVNCISVATEAIGVQILGKSISISESNEEEEEESRHWRSLTQPFPSKSFRQRIIDTREGKRVSSIPGQYLPELLLLQSPAYRLFPVPVTETLLFRLHFRLAFPLYNVFQPTWPCSATTMATNER